jgi:SSS family solute:Na+ symporter
VIVTLLTTKPGNDHYEKIKGLTLWTIKDGPEYFKGSTVNENAGSKITFNGEMIEVVKNTSNEINLPQGLMDELGAKEGDFAYISDVRWYYGGLKSTHANIGKCSSNDNIQISENVQSHGQFDLSKDLFIELEL